MIKRIRKNFAALTLAAVMAITVFPVIPTKASTLHVSEQNSYGALPSAPSISLVQTTVEGQSSVSWKFTYSPLPGEIKYTIPAKKRYGTYSYFSYELGREVCELTEYEFDTESDERTYQPTMEVLVFDKGDVKHEKPEMGMTLLEETAGTYYVINGGISESYVDPEKNPGYKYEFTIDANKLTPGEKEVIAYYYDRPGYQIALAKAEEADDKAYGEAFVAASNKNEEKYRAEYNAWLNSGMGGTEPQRQNLTDYPKREDYTANVQALRRSDYDIASVPVTIKVESEGYANTTVTSNSVKFRFDSSGKASGYELERKVGKKFVKIASVSSKTYTDKGLVSKMTYTYRVRPYYINPISKVTTYGKYNEIQATTKGSALKFLATVNNKNKVKLTWSKANGVSYYEIYRRDTDSKEATSSKGLGDGYESFKKIKKLKKSKKTWTDKSVKANHSYKYMIVAVLKKGKAKGDSRLQISETSDVSLCFGAITEKTDYVNANGDKTITWEKMYGAAGYKIERQDYNMTTKTWDWTPIATLGKNTTKYTFKAFAYNYYKDADAQAADNKSFKSSVKYRITPYKSAGVLGESKEYTVNYKAGIVKKVTAKVDKNAKGIRVSWEKVPGASFYKVYRVMSDTHVNDKDLGGYAISGGTQVYEYVGVTDPVKVDVAAYNAAVDESIAEYEALHSQEYDAYQAECDKKEEEYLKARKEYTDGIRKKAPKLGEYAVNPADFFKTNPGDYMKKSDKLKTDKEYYYQNYSYYRNVFDANTTSILDYYGDVIYHGETTLFTGSTELKTTIDKEYKNSTSEIYHNAYDYEWGSVSNNILGEDGKVTVRFRPYCSTISEDKMTTKLGEYDRPMLGVNYDYYVVAYMGTERQAQDYTDGTYAYTTETKNGVKTKVPKKVTYKGAAKESTKAPLTDESIIRGNRSYIALDMATVGTFIDPITKKKAQHAYTEPIIYLDDEDYKWTTATAGVQTYATASYSNVTPAKQPTLKSVKASKGKVTITIKKKVAGADYYKIYRATRKKGKYHSVGVTSNAKTTKFVDKSTVKGKKYFYKVVSVVRNEANGDVESSASAVKKVKAK